MKHVLTEVSVNAVLSLQLFRQQQSVKKARELRWYSITKPAVCVC